MTDPGRDVSPPAVAEPGTRSFLRDVLALATGGGVAQVLAFAATIVLSRLYSPDEFGAFGVYAFFVAIPAVLVCGCYEPAILLPKSDDEARRVVALSFGITGAVAVAAVLASFFSERIATAFNVLAIVAWLPLMPLQLLALGVAQALTYWLTRAREYHGLAVSRVLQSTSIAGGQVAGASLPSSAGGLVLGQVLGQLVTSLYLVRASVRNGLLLRERIETSSLREPMLRFRKFPLYTSWGTLTGVAAVQILTPLLSNRFGPTEAGLYFFGYRLMSAGILLFSGSLGQVFFERASNRIREGESAAGLVRSLVVRTAAYSALPLLLFALLGGEIFAIAFGSEWRGAGEYMSILVPAFFLQLVAAPVSLIFFVLEKQHVSALIQVALLGGSVAALVVGAALDASPVLTLALYSGAVSLVYLGYLYVILRHVRLTPRELLFGASSG